MQNTAGGKRKFYKRAADRRKLDFDLDNLERKKKTILLLLVAAAIGIRALDLFRPIDHASWREADVGSIARNFATESMNPFYPRIDWRGKTAGFTESEFPIFPYLIAISYKIFGAHDFIGRIWAFLFSLASLGLFWALARKFLAEPAAIAAFAFFAFNPLIVEYSTAIQPEGLMLCFYLAAALYFEKWVSGGGRKAMLAAAVFSALGILSKSSSAHIGIFFGLVLITRERMAFLRRPDVWLFGLISLLPGLLWYWHSRSLYLKYGNSLGISNEYHWVGPDFFTNSYFIKGILHNEFAYVWGLFGLLIAIFAVIRTIRQRATIYSLYWLASAFCFYFLTARTSADDWAYYYHIFSVPPAALLFGIGVGTWIEDGKLLLEKRLRLQPAVLINALGVAIVGLLLAGSIVSGARHLMGLLLERQTPDPRFACAKSIAPILEDDAILLVSGGRCVDPDGYQTAYNASYMFYWLNRRGFNICVEEQSVANVLKFKSRGAIYFIAEKFALERMPGFESQLREQFPVISECDGIIVFDLRKFKGQLQ